MTALDYHEISRRFYEGLSASDVEGITLVVEPKANPAILSAYPGAIRCVGDDVLDRVLGERLAVIGARLEAKPAGWSLSSARSQWGSCTHDGRIRLNWRLVHFSLPVIDYVVAHELAHLKEMNHSPRFWSAVAQLLPGFEAAREQIKAVDLSAL